jgi:hypothetical protein
VRPALFDLMRFINGAGRRLAARLRRVVHPDLQPLAQLRQRRLDLPDIGTVIEVEQSPDLGLGSAGPAIPTSCSSIAS